MLVISTSNEFAAPRGTFFFQLIDEEQVAPHLFGDDATRETFCLFRSFSYHFRTTSYFLLLLHSVFPSRLVITLNPKFTAENLHGAFPKPPTGLFPKATRVNPSKDVNHFKGAVLTRVPYLICTSFSNVQQCQLCAGGRLVNHIPLAFVDGGISVWMVGPDETKKSLSRLSSFIYISTLLTQTLSSERQGLFLHLRGALVHSKAPKLSGLVGNQRELTISVLSVAHFIFRMTSTHILKICEL